MTAPWRSVRRDERGLALAFATTYLLLIGAFTVAKIARDSLFLAELPANYLPYIYLGLALLSALAAAALGKLHRVDARQRLAIVLIITGVSLLLFIPWFLRQAGTAAIVFYLWTGVYGVVLMAEFWLLANDRIDSRQARRLFGPVGAAGILGGLLAAITASAVAPFVDTLWLLAAGGLLYLLAGALTARASVMADSGQGTADSHTETDRHDATPAATRSRYARLLVVTFLLAGVTAAVVDYAFKVVLQGELGESGKIASALGIFYSLQGVVSILAQVGLTGALISRFGHRRAANVLPGGVLVGGVLAATLPVAFAPWAVLGTKLYELTLRYSVTKTAWEFLYFPLSRETKARLKRLVDVVVNRSADAVAGLLLVAVNALLGGSLLHLAITTTALAALWLFCDLRLNRAYADEVDDALRRLVPEEPATDDLHRLVDAEDLAEDLESTDRDRVLAAMSLLERLDPEAVARRAPSLARHPSAAVRARLLAVIHATGREIEPFAPLAPVARTGPASDAVAGLSMAADERVALAAHEGTAGAADADAATLEHLVEDANDDVRRTALRSLGLLADPATVPLLIERLKRPGERAWARQALALYGGSIAGVLEDYSLNPAISIGVRRQLVGTLREIGGAEAARSLYRVSRSAGDRWIVDAALDALLEMRQGDPHVSLEDEEVLADLGAEIDRDGERLAYLQAVKSRGEGPVAGFLERVIRERVDQSFRRVFRRLALVHPTGPVMSAYRGLRSGRRRVRAQAIDYLDTVLPGDLRPRFVPLLDAPDEDERRRQATRLFTAGEVTLQSTLDNLLASDEIWLRVCGLFVVGQQNLETYREAAAAACDASDPVVRETARWAIGRLG